MLRPSGTEPKIKFYFDAKVSVRPDETVETAKRRGESTLDALVAGLARATGVK